VTVVTEALESEEDVSEVDVPPVLNETLWRFAIALATSTSLAKTDEAAKSVRRSVMASERMLRVELSACQASVKMLGFCDVFKIERSGCLQKSEGRS
jgi:hypothetical protein